MLALVTFTLAQQTYGLSVADVQEVLRMVALTPLPGAPPEVLGAINVRGTPVLVLDLRQQFGLPAQPPALTSPLVLVRPGDRPGSQSGAKPLALLVDRVVGVVRVEAPPDAAGLVRLGDSLCLLLRPENLLSAATRALLAELNADVS